MPDLQLVYAPNPVLKRPCIWVDDFSNIPNIAKEMITLMYDKRALGLSAPQIGDSGRFFVARLPGVAKIIVNPLITDISGFQYKTEECLSIPRYIALKMRPTLVQLNYQDENGYNHTEIFTEANARTVMHEYDHLNGILINDKSRLRLDFEDLFRIGSNNSSPFSTQH